MPSSSPVIKARRLFLVVLVSHAPPAFQVLVDAGVLVEGVDGDLGAAGDDLGLERQWLGSGASAAFVLAGEDQLDLVRPSDVEIVGDQGFKECAGPAGGIEDQGGGALGPGH